MTFNVTTSNIADGSYPATAANLPAGVTAGQVASSNNAGALTLNGNHLFSFYTRETIKGHAGFFEMPIIKGCDAYTFIPSDNRNITVGKAA